MNDQQIAYRDLLGMASGLLLITAYIAATLVDWRLGLALICLHIAHILSGKRDRI